LRRKRILALTPVLPLLLVAGACTSSDNGATNKSDIVIAASLELTGAQADIGKVYENALRLKVEQINAGRASDQPKVTLRISDNRSDPGAATAQLGEIASDPSVTAIITGASTECLLAAAKTINDKGMPTISLAPASTVTTPLADRKYIFKLAPNANHDADTLITNLAASGVKKVRFIATKDAYGDDALTFMTAAAKKASLDVGNPGLITATAKPAEIAATIAGEKPDAVVLLTWPAAATTTVDALRGAGYTGRIALDATAAGPLFLTGGAAQDGQSLVFTQTLAIDDVIATTPAKAAQKQWFEDYTARYGSYQAQASFAADAAQIIVDSVDRTGSSTDHNALRATFETVRTDGLSGPIRLTPSDHSGLMPQALTLLTARNGRWRLS
jgi:branched-chain amino acid transport system substrate-binding protein